jgi:NAD(P)-dependent dehydrogenase (short-subunit alcohol dehydrogenase family)
LKEQGESDRLIFISSDSHQGASSIDYNEFGRYFQYGVSKAISNYSYFKLVLNTYATELSRRINKDKLRLSINVICPGPIKTEMLASRPDTSPVDESNFLETGDVAGAALFLASDLSGRMNAQIISVRNSNRW